MNVKKSNVDLEELMEVCFKTLRQEVNYLAKKSGDDKLTSKESQDLIAYTKLLSELDGKQAKLASTLTQETLDGLMTK